MAQSKNKKKSKKDSTRNLTQEELEALNDPYHFIVMLTHDTCWKFVIEYNMAILAPFFLKDLARQLNFNRMEFLNKELQNIMMERAEDLKGYVDKLVKIYNIRWPHKYVLVHFEFQTEAKKEFSGRTGYYKIGLQLNNRDCIIITITIIHRATKYYIHGQHQFGSETNGVAIRYEGYIKKTCRKVILPIRPVWRTCFSTASGCMNTAANFLRIF